jgi:hypothetical protein
VPPDREDEVFAFVSYWGTTEQQLSTPTSATSPTWAELPASAASPAPTASAAAQATPPPPRREAPRQTDFSLFSRSSFFGATLNDAGEFGMPLAAVAQGHQLARDAKRHGSAVDLVLYRNDWESLLKRPPQELAAFAARAAQSALQLIDARQMHLNPTMQALLLPIWRDETFAYDGATVFFDKLPPEGSAAAAAFRSFHRVFTLALIRGMQSTQRRYRLTIVVPAQRMGDDLLFGLKDMVDLVKEAEPKRSGKNVAVEDMEAIAARPTSS